MLLAVGVAFVAATVTAWFLRQPGLTPAQRYFRRLIGPEPAGTRPLANGQPAVSLAQVGERLLRPLLEHAGRAGLTMPPANAIAACVIVSVAGGGLGWMLGTGTGRIPFLLAGVACGPLVLIQGFSMAANTRRQRIKADLPELAELLGVAAEAGAGLEGALQRVALRMSGPVREDLDRMLTELRLGSKRSDALRHLGDRWDLPEANAFVGALVQATQMGTGLTQTLKAQAKAMRVLAHQQAREKSLRLPTKMIFPLVFLMLPAMMLIVLGPAAIGMIGSF